MNADSSKVFDQITKAAEMTVDLKGLTPRDKNALIGKLRDAAAFLRGAEGLADFKQAPYTGTRDAKGGDKPADATSSTPIKR